MMGRIFIDGVGNAGTAVLHALTGQQWPATGRPEIEVRDRSRSSRRHVEAALVDPVELGRPKVVAAARRLREAGWTDDSVTAVHGDIHDLPRGAYRGGLTLAMTDSHATKHLSVLRSQQVGCPAIAVGLGSGDATVELFMPGGAGYCCVHGNDSTWQRRQPCLPVSSVSTTEIAWRRSRDTVRVAGELVARIIAYYIDRAAGCLTTAAITSVARPPPCMRSPEIAIAPARTTLPVGWIARRWSACRSRPRNFPST